ncbi:hypothetical protein T4E_7795 [Trichinella pseudospiralis]|uniref:Uncharacterized protein n=1 Tax=Trichinella pseudospiralis TaxID=6337 RepID=A0A0V0YAS7_TRIPS|nr:hypothetical protein T4E_7795 [Trichinella pseudospiralis]
MIFEGSVKLYRIRCLVERLSIVCLLAKVGQSDAVVVDDRCCFSRAQLTARSGQRTGRLFTTAVRKNIAGTRFVIGDRVVQESIESTGLKTGLNTAALLHLMLHLSSCSLPGFPILSIELSGSS